MVISGKREEIVVSGIGITSSVGIGKREFSDALLKGKSNFGMLNREGRQHEGKSFVGAEIGQLPELPNFPMRFARTCSLSTLCALNAINEAWHEAKLADQDPKRIGLFIGGSNFQARHLMTLQAQASDPSFINPNYGLSVFDTDLGGVCTEYFGISGMSCTVGGASASGQLVILHAINAILAGQVDTCIVLGALTDLSYWELQAFQSLGAMASEGDVEHPHLACRPFDAATKGFVFGESSGALVIERASTAQFRGSLPYVVIKGIETVSDGHRNPDPSFEGECAVIKKLLKNTGLSASQINYVNPHGTGSKVGDAVELAALAHCGLRHASINTTKSITGHGLTAAGMIELIATILQMKQGQLHPSLNLESPIDEDFNWVRTQAQNHKVDYAINMSIGFGGVNTALCLQNI
ncbi:Polyketide biosynthesis malonyl-ACP decarboxylase PksF [Pseudoalteromonas holothuriae]|uniref:Polyketide biosynthesis malonyl-ACP decarboxylase PksF n=1 Tax=Pseudoalteromonas holothuriae TaxID=2963714 RepID=A0A9W4R3R4_9GAMM|nr:MULTISPECIES: beta-ketoacyl synthase N-terminal-like domain-containing protein [unclassified Pseudoalteromonas]CAH9066875.1 Polyketide biosynthesis malonyl-ACP decarboxylase PksF [Pseudoalteromonas sp. CIP111854]CAH9068045.1 Polyketide biosynthesis malonyl-ACP decarboxylase PksF [Pseudoalteromonas sp. CIP111951]